MLNSTTKPARTIALVLGWTLFFRETLSLSFDCQVESQAGATESCGVIFNYAWFPSCPRSSPALPAATLRELACPVNTMVVGGLIRAKQYLFAALGVGLAVVVTSTLQTHLESNLSLPFALSVMFALVLWLGSWLVERRAERPVNRVFPLASCVLI